MPDGGLVSAIAIRPDDSNHLVAGTHKGDVLVARNATANVNAITFTRARPRDGWVTSIAHDARSTGVVYATYRNFGGDHVYRSRDFGQTWTALPGSGSGVLPNLPVHAIVVDPDDPQRLYLGTDLGVIVSVDGGRTWMTEETGFGPAVTEWLQVLRAADGNKYLFAFTHGRGAWRVRLP
ncbi:MAG: WD40/YVTN/BNR-like repeat-containing protein [Acidimicrobiia bacterium]